MEKFKTLSNTLKKVSGRSFGQIVSPRRGGGLRNRYRMVNFKRDQFSNEVGKIKTIQKYSLTSNTFVGIVVYTTGYITSILLAEGSYEQQFVFNNSQRTLFKNLFSRNFSSITNLGSTPPGSILYNIELLPGHGGQVNRSAGASAVILKSVGSSDYARLKLKSGELRQFHKKCVASIGVASNASFFLNKLKRAGDLRRLGRRPRVRPYAMNPVDHPMGGRTKGGIQAQNRNGLKSTTPTRRTKKPSNVLILVGHRKNRLNKR